MFDFCQLLSALHFGFYVNGSLRKALILVFLYENEIYDIYETCFMYNYINNRSYKYLFTQQK